MAQDITGLWKGTLYNDTTKQTHRYEIAISEFKGKLTGYSHTWFIVEDKQYYGVKKVKIKKQGGKIIVEDVEVISNNFPVIPPKNVRQLNVLDLNLKDSTMLLTGPFSTNRTKEYLSLTGSINIERKNNFWQSALVPHLQELSLLQDLSFVTDELLASQDIATVQKEYIPFSPVVVSKKDIKTEKPVVSKNKKEVNKAVAVNKRIVMVPEEPAKPKTAVKSTSVKNDPSKDVARQAIKTQPPVSGNKATGVPKVSQQPVVVTSKPEILITDPPKMVGAAQDVTARNTVLQQTIFFKSDSLQLSLYDNGEVDGDTVSVLMNGKIIFAKERLSTTALRQTIAIDPSADSIQLVMYAENLGSIPPNTGLLIVRDGKDIYEIRFSGDLNRNAGIVFRRRK
ncbi:MAG: hypothetical protein ABIP80_04115 [Ferruginibacter sp.]